MHIGLRRHPGGRNGIDRMAFDILSCYIELSWLAFLRRKLGLVTEVPHNQFKAEVGEAWYCNDSGLVLHYHEAPYSLLNILIPPTKVFRIPVVVLTFDRSSPTERRDDSHNTTCTPQTQQRKNIAAEACFFGPDTLSHSLSLSLFWSVRQSGSLGIKNQSVIRRPRKIPASDSM